ncbi:T9SS type A sorting domain-containing protein, partial [candidate division WOR-3 bacterium]|nr:T9SS type A sorting domain-containing protein [candidate division WOR-3 bacterium]
RAYSLAPWVGRSVFIRFRYMTDDNTVGTGVYIDDVWPVPAFSGRTTISSNITDTLYSFTGKAAGTYYYRVRGRNVAWGWNDFGPLEDVVVVRRDVGVTALLAPSGTVDSGNVVVPACSVYNYGTLTEAYAVSMRIGTDYAEATMVIGHAPGTTRYVTFPGWTAGRRGTYAVTCSTRLGGDADSSNDARAGAVTVQVRDVACRRLLAPAGTVDSGITVTPACSVANPGSTTESYQVRMKVGTFYNLTTTVANHAPGTTVYITFPNWVATQLGTHAVSCSTELSDDLVQANNRQSGLVTVERPPLHDVGATVVIAPTGTNDSGTSVVPACTVYNYGNMPESYLVRMKVGTTYNETASVTGHAPGARLYVTFPSWNASARGTHVVTCSTELATDTRPDNDRASGQVEVRVADVDLSTILFPVDSVPLGTVVAPRVRLRNNGTGPAVFPVRLVITGTTVVFDTTEADVALNPGETRDYLFAGSWTAGPAGDYTTLAWTALGGDLVPANDSARNAFAVSAAGAGGWVEKRSMPLLTSGKQAKDGAWLAFAPSGRGLTLHASRLTPDRGPALDPSTPRSPDPSLSGVVYAAKGNKSSDFYRYDVERDTWTTLASIPDGRENKKPGKGAVGAAGGGYVYAVKGNNTQGFWRYAPSQDSWQQMADVPLGLSNKKAKGGTDLVYVGDLGQYPERLYLLKGGRNEFWRYDVSRDSWRETSEAPIGLSGRIKYDKGSWLAYAPAGAVPSEFGIVYCHKAKYHELYAFQPVTEVWLPQQLDGMPFVGRSGKKKKSKDGGSAAILDGYVYALKGGNTDEFWQYAPEQDSWTELEPMPLLGSTGKAKKVKAGADATATHDFLFALKGNKTLEFWRYAPGTTLDASRATPDAREGGQSGMKSDASGVVRISPNPLRAGFVTLRWDMTGVGHDRIAFGQFGSRPEHAGVSLFDATGRCVRRRALSLGHEASGIVLDLRALPAGVYLLRLTAGGYSTTQKLVIQR